MPAVSWTVRTFADLAAAPMRPCCAGHEALVSDRYAAAVEWALHHDGITDPDAVRMISELLQGMKTPMLIA